MTLDHKKRHLNKREFKCFYNNCNKSFVKNYELKQHINSIHSTEKLFKCLFENCHKIYGNKRSLNKAFENKSQLNCF